MVDTLPAGVGILQSVINMDSRDRKVKLCLLNLTDHEVHIPKLQRVATVQPA